MSKKGKIHIKDKNQFGVWLLTFVWVCLAIAAFCVPPVGDIPPSVLKAGGIFFAFAGLLTFYHAIDLGLGAKVSHGETTLEVTTEKDNDNETEIS